MHFQSSSKNSSSTSCGNCASLTAKLNESEKNIKEKTTVIRDLKGLCAKFEKQLKQQDELLKLWAESKGHSIPVFP